MGIGINRHAAAFALFGAVGAQPALAIPAIQNVEIPPLVEPQFSATFTSSTCNFTALPANGVCVDGDGALRNAGGSWDLTLNNQANPDAIKYLRLAIELNDTIMIKGVATNVVFDIFDDMDMFIPTVAAENGEAVDLKAISFIPGQFAQWQMFWHIRPQPGSETVTLRDWNMFIFEDKNGNHVGDPGEELGTMLFDPSWLKSINLASHCPEPGSWAMMIFGFGFVGSRLRRTRGASAPA